MLPGGERLCLGAHEVTQLLQLYRQARPDDATLARATVYELTDDGDQASGPLELDRFIQAIGSHQDA